MHYLLYMYFSLLLNTSKYVYFFKKRQNNDIKFALREIAEFNIITKCTY